MLLPTVFVNFVNGSPVSVMLRAILEQALPATEIDQLFTDTAEQQYTRELLFSAVVDVMGEVVCRIRPSVHAAYQANPAKLGVSIRALYDKLARTEPGIAAALVAHTARKLAPLLQRLGGGLPAARAPQRGSGRTCHGPWSWRSASQCSASAAPRPISSRANSRAKKT